MRVLMVSDVYFPRINGVSTAIQTYRRSLLAHGVEVVLAAPDYGDVCREPWIRRVPARPVPGDPEDRLAHWRRMHETVEQAVGEGCDLVHIQTPSSPIMRVAVRRDVEVYRSSPRITPCSRSISSIMRRWRRPVGCGRWRAAFRAASATRSTR